jgi:hypothetical protein
VELKRKKSIGRIMVNIPANPPHDDKSQIQYKYIQAIASVSHK